MRTALEALCLVLSVPFVVIVVVLVAADFSTLVRKLAAMLIALAGAVGFGLPASSLHASYVTWLISAVIGGLSWVYAAPSRRSPGRISGDAMINVVLHPTSPEKRLGGGKHSR